MKANLASSFPIEPRAFHASYLARFMTWRRPGCAPVHAPTVACLNRAYSYSFSVLETVEILGSDFVMKSLAALKAASIFSGVGFAFSAFLNLNANIVLYILLVLKRLV